MSTFCCLRPAYAWAILIYSIWLQRIAPALAPICAVINTHEFLQVPDDYLPDWIHLNAQGHQKISAALLEAMGAAQNVSATQRRDGR
jgi:lysophospholipase L1-like esterase